jgi:hypothetical protein
VKEREKAEMLLADDDTPEDVKDWARKELQRLGIPLTEAVGAT